MSNPGMRLTRAGKRILAQGLLGDEIHFTKIAFGDAEFDYETENLQELTELKSWRLDLPIVGRTLNGDGTVTIVGLCTNFTLTKGFRAKEIGIFAIDQESGNEILYAYRNAGDEYSFIPAKTGVVTKSVRYAYQIEIGDAENVTFDINFSFAYVSQEAFEEHVNSESPHPQFVETQKLARENRQIINAQAETPFEGNLFIFEDFKPPTCIDNFKVKVTNCVAGANLITVNSIDKVKIGDYFWLGDGEKFERVKITSVMKVASGLHVKAGANLTQNYDLSKTFLYRTTFGTICEENPAMPIEIFTKKFSAEVDLKNCAAIIRHSELIDAELSATAFLYETPQKRENIFLGTGDGTNKIFTISDANIDRESLEIQVNGEVATDYFFETGNAYVKLTAPRDSTVTASYIYGGAALEIPLAENSTAIECNHFITKFSGETDLNGYQIAAISIKLTKLAEMLPEDEPKILHISAAFGAE